MVNGKHVGLLVCILSASLVSLAWAEVPDLDNSTATTAASEQVSVYSIPNGAGDGLDNAYVFGGARTNATVTLTLLTDTFAPVVNYSFEDLWIAADTGTFAFCPGGTVADASTDVNGQTTFSNPMFAGASGTGLVIIVDFNALNQPPLDYLFNSPDISGDLVVDLTDVVLFSQNFFGPYAYRSDFFWDGQLDLSDIVLLAQGMGGQCP